MKILSFNIALLDFKILGFKVLRPTRFIDLRLKAIPSSIIKLNLDIVCLQEVYNKSHKLFLKRELKNNFPYCYYNQQNNFIGFDNGLMIFSKHKIESNHFEALYSQPFEEKLLTKKGLINITVVINSIRYSITNTHTTASGVGFQQDNARIEALRDSQISQIIKTSERIKKSENCDVSLICGDFNCGPQVSESNYALLTYSKYLDTFNQTNKEEFPTWDPENILNQDSPVFKSSPKQRIDFILCDKLGINKVECKYNKIIFTEPLIETNEGKKIPLSDHYAVIAEFE